MTKPKLRIVKSAKTGRATLHDLSLGLKAFSALFIVGVAVMLGPTACAQIGKDIPAPIVAASPSLDVRVIDGDTIEDRTTHITYRLPNLDTAETGSRAQCAAERAHGDAATAAMRQMVQSAKSISVRPTGRKDQYGRTIAFLIIDGRDAGESMIAKGLARSWRGRRENWCGPNGELLR